MDFSAASNFIHQVLDSVAMKGYSPAQRLAALYKMLGIQVD